MTTRRGPVPEVISRTSRHEPDFWMDQTKCRVGPGFGNGQVAIFFASRSFHTETTIKYEYEEDGYKKGFSSDSCFKNSSSWIGPPNYSNVGRRWQVERRIKKWKETRKEGWWRRFTDWMNGEGAKVIVSRSYREDKWVKEHEFVFMFLMHGVCEGCWGGVWLPHTHLMMCNISLINNVLGEGSNTYAVPSH